MLEPIPPSRPQKDEKKEETEESPSFPFHTPPTSPNSELVNQLLDMGFNYDMIISALKETNDNLERSIDILQRKSPDFQSADFANFENTDSK